MRKEDRRNSYTRKAIRDAVFSLLRTKPIERISVTEVCKLADINRSTFYLHYYDCMDVLEQEQEKFCDKLIALIDNRKSGETMDVIEELHGLVREDHDFYLMLIRSHNPMRSFAKFTDYCRRFFVDNLRERCSLSEEECDLIAQYIISGSFTISMLFAEEKEFDAHREEIFKTLTEASIGGIMRKYPK